MSVLIKKIFSLVTVIIISTTLYAQIEGNEIIEKEFKVKDEGFAQAWKSVKTADKIFKTGNVSLYEDACKEYLKACAYNSANPELNYRIGICKLASADKASALPYLKIASQKQYSSAYVNYYLAQAQIYNLEYDDAIKNLDTFIASKPSANAEYIKIARKLKEQCQTGKKMIENPVDVTITPIETINSEYPDYCPVITMDESLMILTSRRPETTGNTFDKNDGLPCEDVYISRNINGEWQKPENVGSPVNTENHDASAGISPDGRKIILYLNGDLYWADYKDGKWNTPEKFPDNIDKPYVAETSACLSYDGNTLIFTRGKSQEENSNGDIYMSNRTKTGWSNPVKLPANINTPLDEEGVFLHPDGKTLYFSSKGHNSMGGFDIFKTVKQSNGTWSDPENLGYPINTPDNDVYFVVSADGKTGYYSAARKEGKGYTDIYKIVYNQPETTPVDTNQVPVVASLKLLTVDIVDIVSDLKVDAEIEIYNLDENKTVLKADRNDITGKYIVSLPSGPNYKLTVKADNYMYYSENFNLKNNHEFSKIEKTIKIEKLDTGSKAILNNLFFDIDRYEIKSESLNELNEIAQMLKKNNSLKIEISGHTDNTGNNNHNLELSKNRAQAVADYLIKSGIDAIRLTIKGAGSSEPTADDSTEEGREKNRRVEIKIIDK